MDGDYYSINLDGKIEWDEDYYDTYSRFFMLRANKPPRYNRMFMDYFVSIGKEITPYIELRSKFLTIEKDLEDCRGKDGHHPNIGRLQGGSKLFNATCFVENDNFILFRYGMPPGMVILFNKKTGDCIKQAKMTREKMSF